MRGSPLSPLGVQGDIRDMPGNLAYLHKKSRPKAAFFVEMGGLEPPSKQSTGELSTRLFFQWLWAANRWKTDYLQLIS